jgi:hypothetical protein
MSIFIPKISKAQRQERSSLGIDLLEYWKGNLQIMRSAVETRQQ